MITRFEAADHTFSGTIVLTWYVHWALQCGQPPTTHLWPRGRTPDSSPVFEISHRHWRPMVLAQELPSYDYIIVGAGTAGSVLAHRLTEDPDVSVLLIEAGGSDRHPLLAMPVAFPLTW